MVSDDLRVTIRLLPEEKHVYPEFKDLVINQQHSDVCYVLTMLMKAYTQAVKEVPNPDDRVTMEFLKQTVQINMGCNFNYYTKKSRRLPNPQDVTQKNYILPNLIDQWDSLKPEAKVFWLMRLQQAGIVKEEPQAIKKESRWKIVRHLSQFWFWVKKKWG